MRQYIFIGIITLLIAGALYLQGRVDSLQGELKTTNTSLATCRADLKDARETIDNQSAEIVAAAEAADEEVVEATERVVTIYQTLPAQIEKDHADPADALSINRWFEGVFQ